jgi:DinB superfamily
MKTLSAPVAAEPRLRRPVARQDRSAPSRKSQLLQDYLSVRRFSEQLCQTLEPEDYVIQTMPEMSPTKWHLAHTSWFFETFAAKPHLRDYRPLHPQYAFLFNSYYNAAGKMHARPQRGLISRPTVRDTYAYRQYVDTAMERLLQTADESLLRTLEPLVVLGLNHEQQHQELMLTDIKHSERNSSRRNLPLQLQDGFMLTRGFMLSDLRVTGFVSTMKRRATRSF